VKTTRYPTGFESGANIQINLFTHIFVSEMTVDKTTTNNNTIIILQEQCTQKCTESKKSVML